MEPQTQENLLSLLLFLAIISVCGLIVGILLRLADRIFDRMRERMKASRSNRSAASCQEDSNGRN